jgi:hypothetical protein
LHELILSKTFCGSVAELPCTLHSFKANVREHSIAAIHSVLQRLPPGLQRLQLSYRQRHRRSTGLSEWMAAGLPALSNLRCLHLEGVEWSISCPTCLQELYLSHCKFSGELQLPTTLRKLELVHYSSSNSSSTSMVVHLNEGLQQLVIASWRRVEFGRELPATLTHLVLAEREISSSLRASLGALPSGLLLFGLDEQLNEPLWVLPSTLQVLRLGDAYTQPLGVLPDKLLSST